LLFIIDYLGIMRKRRGKDGEKTGKRKGKEREKTRFSVSPCIPCVFIMKPVIDSR
jgi:hypothetical protein